MTSLSVYVYVFFLTASPAPAVKKRDDLTFDDDEDDLMDALGFGETHKTQGNGKTQKKDR